MTLQGWSLPRSPDGTASLVPPPPWHVSGDALAARVPYRWVDSDLSFARATVGRGRPRDEAGATFAAHVSSLGERLAHASIAFTITGAEIRSA